MSRIKASIRKNEVDKSGKVNIKIRIHHNGKTRYIGTRFSVKPTQFSVKNGRVLKSHPLSAFINAELKKLEANYESKLVSSDDPERLDVRDVVSILRKKYRVVNIFDLFDEVAREKKNADTSTYRRYLVTKRTLERYYGSSMLPISEVDESFLKSFSESRFAEGSKPNTVSQDLAIIRAVFNRGIDKGVILADLYPFRKMKLARSKTSKRSLSVDQLKTLYSATLRKNEKMAVDIFFLSFFFIGINMKDLYWLRKQDVANGRVIYTRAKTKKEYSVKIEPEAQEIIDRHCSVDDEWLLSSIHKRYDNVDTFTHGVNSFLRTAAINLKMNITPTTYFARHSWATLAYNNGISKDNVRLALGHGGETVTDTYIDFDLLMVDMANRKIIDLIV